MTNRMTTRMAVVSLVLVLIVSACANADDGFRQAPGSVTPPSAEQISPPPELNAASVATGEDLYRQYCASCHGIDLTGDPNWKTPDADGSYPPPPQDSSGHTWHHGDQVLVGLIRDGPDLAVTRMPPFGSQLSDEQIASILEYFKSHWGPDERAFQWGVSLRETADE